MVCHLPLLPSSTLLSLQRLWQLCWGNSAADWVDFGPVFGVAHTCYWKCAVGSFPQYFNSWKFPALTLVMVFYWSVPFEAQPPVMIYVTYAILFDVSFVADDNLVKRFTILAVSSSRYVIVKKRRMGAFMERQSSGERKVQGELFSLVCLSTSVGTSLFEMKWWTIRSLGMCGNQSQNSMCSSTLSGRALCLHQHLSLEHELSHASNVVPLNYRAFMFLNNPEVLVMHTGYLKITPK